MSLSGPENVTLARNAIAGSLQEGLSVEGAQSGAVVDARTGAVADGSGESIVTDDAEVCFDPWLADRPG